MRRELSLKLRCKPESCATAEKLPVFMGPSPAHACLDVYEAIGIELWHGCKDLIFHDSCNITQSWMESSAHMPVPSCTSIETLLLQAQFTGHKWQCLNQVRPYSAPEAAQKRRPLVKNTHSLPACSILKLSRISNNSCIYQFWTTDLLSWLSR